MSCVPTINSFSADLSASLDSTMTEARTHARRSQQASGAARAHEHPMRLSEGAPESAHGRHDYHNWIREGRRIGAIGRGSPWWVGDWLHYGTARWGEKYLEAVKITGYDAKSLRNMRYVSSRFDLSLRRDDLTWSHHALLAAMEPDEQTHWLNRAVADRFSVDDLRIELRSAQRGGYAPREPRCEPQSDGPDELTSAPALVCPQCGYEAMAMAFAHHDGATPKAIPESASKM
jgi:hypothetical protein